jgi:hypothetical protein
MQQKVGGLIITAAEKSGFVSKEFARAWRDSLNTPIDAKTAERDAANRKEQSDLETWKAEQQAAIEESRKQQQAALTTQEGAEHDANLAKWRDERTAREAALKDSKDKLMALREKARENLKEEKKQSEESRKGGMGVTAGAREVAGTFTAAVAGLITGGDNPQQEVAANTRELIAIGRRNEALARDQKRLLEVGGVLP